MTLYNTELSVFYDDGIIEDLFYSDGFVISLLAKKCLVAIPKNAEAREALGCYGAFVIDGRTAEMMAADPDLFKAKAISRTEPYETMILLDTSLPQRLATFPALSEEDEAVVLRLKEAYTERHSKLLKKHGIPPLFSNKRARLAVLLSVLLGFVGAPFFYFGRYIIGVLSLIPFILTRFSLHFPSLVSIGVTVLFAIHMCNMLFILPYLIQSGRVKDRRQRYVLSERNQADVRLMMYFMGKYTEEVRDCEKTID